MTAKAKCKLFQSSDDKRRLSKPDILVFQNYGGTRIINTSDNCEHDARGQRSDRKHIRGPAR